MNRRQPEKAPLTIWGIVFLLVSLQKTTTLRPIIGRSDHFHPREKIILATLEQYRRGNITRRPGEMKGWKPEASSSSLV